jgi:asparagine synthetase B (glutamine-hydrolysing)
MARLARFVNTVNTERLPARLERSQTLQVAGQPFASWAQDAADGVDEQRVAAGQRAWLSGEGADEIFGGYGSM